jgi:hypothetical protein
MAWSRLRSRLTGPWIANRWGYSIDNAVTVSITDHFGLYGSHDQQLRMSRIGPKSG